jgi:hypothetical protein
LHVSCDSERKAIATCAKESGVTIPSGFSGGKELLQGVSATGLVALGVVLMQRHGHARTRSFPNIQWRSISAEDIHRRPHSESA